jgi:DNA-binding NarL/FixJ family response regulator
MVYRQLTDRQGEVVRLLCEGKTEHEIAEQFGITLMTVKQHRFNARQRLGRISLIDLCRVAEEETPLAVRRL